MRLFISAFVYIYRPRNLPPYWRRSITIRTFLNLVQSNSKVIMKIDEVKSTVKTQRISAHSHVKVSSLHDQKDSQVSQDSLEFGQGFN
jgi:hypothetical protein